jgi:hypothetical protein
MACKLAARLSTVNDRRQAQRLFTPVLRRQERSSSLIKDPLRIWAAIPGVFPLLFPESALNEIFADENGCVPGRCVDIDPGPEQDRERHEEMASITI